MKRFFDKVLIANSGCWEWQASTRATYGAFKFRGKTYSAHRVSWILHYGDIAGDLLVCHKCDNRLCVNPDHLFLGTYSDNSKDAYDKGRISVPDKARFLVGHIPINRTLTDTESIDQVKEAIKNRTVSLKQLSITLNLPYQLIRDISSGRVYK